MDVILRSRLIAAVERVLHVPGNYQGGILEMTIVFDQSLAIDCQRRLSAEIAKLLKSHSEVFRNVRLNAVCWEKDEQINTELVPMSMLMMGKYPPEPESSFENASSCEAEKSLHRLLEYLKLFHARSKLVLLLTNGHIYIEETAVKEALKPFLEKKLVVITTDKMLPENLLRHVVKATVAVQEEV